MARKRKISEVGPTRASKRVSIAAVDPGVNIEVRDGVQARAASPDAQPILVPEPTAATVYNEAGVAEEEDQSTADFNQEDTTEAVQAALRRPPPVHSDFIPLPWKGRLGYACLNTYLRTSNPPVFSSRTCRIASIIEHRHPLQDPTLPEHPTKNRPDKEKPADLRLGQRWVENLGLANARDIVKMIRWNDRYGIKFMRLSSEMFPFASHQEYGYKLAPFASEVLAQAGQVIAELGHRVTTHPGQFTQLGSPRTEVVANAVRDLEYHDEMLTLLKLPEQQNRDAVMILHMGGTFGSKEDTLARFRENYANLSDSVKQRLVLENDDVSWSVHDLLPICEELGIPMVLDFHHHNILFDETKVREGSLDIIQFFPQIKATWTRKRITQKMHYSEQTPSAITAVKRRKHSPRVATLPPCAPDMDLMIEAKDKEQAVFELMRTFKLPGWHTFRDIHPHLRSDENPKSTAKKTTANQVKIDEESVGMGGPDGRVYWPPGMEDWLRPKKREAKTSKSDGSKTPQPKTPHLQKAVKKPKSSDVDSKRDRLNAGKLIARNKSQSVPTPATSEGDVSPPPKRRASRKASRVNYTEATVSE